MGKHTPLHDEHKTAGAKLVDFAGWDMPINYGSQIAEHNAVRESAGMFDVSHMRPVDVEGADARDFLRHVLANDVAKIDTVGRALYTCMLNTRGGVIDDLIVYHLGETWYRIVVNAATADKDLGWLHSLASDYEVTVTEFEDSSIIAVQGPEAREKCRAVLGAAEDEVMDLAPFRALAVGNWSIGRTGYTGEDGFEIVLPAAEAVDTWQALAAAGVQPIGLGARDTLRLEAGLNLYGHEMDEDVTPLASGLGWTVAFEPAARDFVGRDALEMARDAGNAHKLVGLVLDARGVIREGAAVRRAGDEAGAEESTGGEVTSGSFGPTVQRSIGLARVPVDWEGAVEVSLRGKWRAAHIVSYPFVRHGKIRIALD
ncbi:glycine cleavage system aminomethyltransferase GcvT [Salinisphaera sp. Q1T1-3]|uniref:glycine cleavage system aminomethyltransferase GcvT n=1 Tax=Salinisphaera sp. Q1T1-3 TaxID=2321229 RepID=UPI000E74D0D4|nr:glycine cleavage system aminomethyltransferase GcvT [Salinisphaera sp. Q1T1-3]RJS92375.1 glycine cleavage system aminomethyltransferase GcvT [Salinisphaera sp. Q1T1-3]